MGAPGNVHKRSRDCVEILKAEPREANIRHILEANSLRLAELFAIPGAVRPISAGARYFRPSPVALRGPTKLLLSVSLSLVPQTVVFRNDRTTKWRR